VATIKAAKEITEVEPFLEYLSEYFLRDDAKPKSSVAAEAKISRMYLHDLIERNNGDPSLSVAIRLSIAMGTTLEKILKKSVSHA